MALKIPRLQGRPVEMTARFALERNILATLEYPGIARLYDAGVEVSLSTPEALSDYMVREMERWGKVVKETGVKLE